MLIFSEFSELFVSSFLHGPTCPFPNFIHDPQLEETLVGNSGGGATRALVVAMVRGVFGCEPKDRKNSAPRHSGTGIFTYMNGGFVWQVI